MNNLNPLSQMTDESLKAFISKVQADTSPQERLNVEGTAPIALASAAGIVINTEDLNTYLQNLSDVELKVWLECCGMHRHRHARALLLFPGLRHQCQDAESIEVA